METRPSGYYFVKENKNDEMDIGFYSERFNSFMINSCVVQPEQLTYISDTPITHSAIQALEEILTLSHGKPTYDKRVNEILQKHNLLTDK